MPTQIFGPKRSHAGCPKKVVMNTTGLFRLGLEIRDFKFERSDLGCRNNAGRVGIVEHLFGEIHWPVKDRGEGENNAKPRDANPWVERS
jgi:hypothetical protein